MWLAWSAYENFFALIPKYIWIGFITFASDINPINELEIISIKNKYKRKLSAVQVLVIVVIVVIVVVVDSYCSA